MSLRAQLAPGCQESGKFWISYLSVSTCRRRCRTNQVAQEEHASTPQYQDLFRRAPGTPRWECGIKEGTRASNDAVVKIMAISSMFRSGDRAESVQAETEEIICNIESILAL